jgi:hypothetical protein
VFDAVFRFIPDDRPFDPNCLWSRTFARADDHFVIGMSGQAFFLVFLGQFSVVSVPELDVEYALAVEEGGQFNPEFQHIGLVDSGRLAVVEGESRDKDRIEQGQVGNLGVFVPSAVLVKLLYMQPQRVMHQRLILRVTAATNLT